VVERGLFTLADAGGRGEIYANALARIAERPLLGYGLDSFAMAYELGGGSATLEAVTQVDAHSSYLENWVEGGVIFGSAMILAGLLYLRRLRAVAGGLLGGKTAEGAAEGSAEGFARPPALVAASLGVLVLAGLHGLVDFSFEIEANVMVLTMILALGVTPLRRPVRP
jgi:O-antigen ligase